MLPTAQKKEAMSIPVAKQSTQTIQSKIYNMFKIGKPFMTPNDTVNIENVKAKRTRKAGSSRAN